MYLGFSTQLGRKLIEDIKFAEDNKFNALSLDLSWKPNLDFSAEEMSKLKKFSQKGNIICIHMPFFLYVNTSIKEIFIGIKKYFEKVMIFCEEIGAKIITFHTGYVEQIGKYKTPNYLIKNLKELVKLAKNKNICLSVENDDKNPNYPLWCLDEVNGILSEIPELKFTFDPGHANTAGYKIQEFYEGVKSKTNVVHLHNNYGKDSHNSLDEGDINFKEFLSINLNPTLIYILEIFPYKKILDNQKLFILFSKKESKEHASKL